MCEIGLWLNDEQDWSVFLTKKWNYYNRFTKKMENKMTVRVPQIIIEDIDNQCTTIPVTTQNFMR